MPADLTGDHQVRGQVGAAWLDRLVIAVGVVATIAVFYGHRASLLAAFAFGTVIAVSTWLSVIDVREHRLPNKIVGPLALAVIAGVVIGGFVQEDLARSWRALGFGFAVAGVLLVANLLAGIGMGDVKYGFPMAATVGWFGWDALVLALMATALSAGVAAAVVVLVDRGGTGSASPQRKGLVSAAGAIVLVTVLIMGAIEYVFAGDVFTGGFGWDVVAVGLTILMLATVLVAAFIVLVFGRGRGLHLPYGPFMALGLAARLLTAAPW